MDVIDYSDQHRNLVRMLEDQMTLGLFKFERNEPVIILKPERVQILDGSRIDSFVKIEGGQGVIIGRFVHIASFAHLNVGGGKLAIGDYCAVASGGKLVTGGNQPEGKSMSASAPEDLQCVNRGRIVLEDYACVCTNAVVLPNVRLHEGAVLAAGSVAKVDIPAWEIWGGIPARRLRFRHTGEYIPADYSD